MKDKTRMRKREWGIKRGWDIAAGVLNGEEQLRMGDKTRYDWWNSKDIYGWWNSIR